MKYRSSLALVFCIQTSALGGCRRDLPAVEPEQEPSAAEPSIVAAQPDTDPSEPPAEETTAPVDARPAAVASGPPIDLLRSVRTDLAVSSAFRDKLLQAAMLVDGDLETAWNSKTSDLVGAWIEVRLPPDAKVTSIALTAGFTKRTEQSDLFTGNYRIAKVRVLRAGSEVGVFDLDTESGDLQTLPVEGPGGVYRVEVVAVMAGTDRRWREACVSELRVLGTSAGAREGERFPRFGLGVLPAERPEPGTADRAEVTKTFQQLVQWLTTEWDHVISGEAALNNNTGQPEEDRATIPGLLLKRRQVFERVSELTGLVDEVQADRLRAAAIRRDGIGESTWNVFHPDDHASLVAGLDAVVAWLDDGDARCRWAKADSGLRLAIMRSETLGAYRGCEAAGWSDRECNAAERNEPLLRELDSLWQDSPRQAAARIARTELPRSSAASTLAAWSALKTRVELARQTCGWAGE